MFIMKLQNKSKRQFIISFYIKLQSMNSPYYSITCLPVSASRFDAFLIARHRHFNLQNQIINPCPTQVVRLEDWTKIGLQDSSIESIVKALTRIQDLKLKEEETALLCALSLMFPGRHYI